MEKTQHKKKRIYEISVLNVILCMLVVYIHVTSAPVTGYDPESIQYVLVLIPWRLAAFVVQGFVFLGGLRLFLNREKIENYGAYYLSKIKRVLIPYVLWVLVYYGYFLIKGYFKFDLPNLLEYIVKGDLVSHLYFIVIIMQFYLLAPLWNLMVKKIKPAAALIVSLVTMVIMGIYLPRIIGGIFPGTVFRYNDRLFTTYLFYWVAGCFAGINYEGFKGLLRKYSKHIAAVFLGLAVMDGSITYYSFSNSIYLPWLEYVHISYCISAVFFFFILASGVKEGKGVFTKMLKDVDRSAYYIYLSHVMFILLANDFMELVGIGSISIEYVIRTAAVYTATIGSALILQKIKTGIKGLG